ncbi:VOC family protein [Streptomyces sp. NBC_00525]|uniref:VOC family protein n=1 Tax=Streptomyces sp. NBC_00525 TaxID=2903660 RepID=UPI002E81E4C3|nr:VOC family protein [Streptomyces sp. NBC_00525]WUC97303.1 VOC family protein [Streptomyces sp. NBC_00525]
MPSLEWNTPVAGAPCWVSLASRDLDAARTFYARVMGWEFRDSSLGGDFLLARAQGRAVAGVGRCPGAVSPPPAWIPYFAVPDADRAAGRIRERGATLAVGPLPLGEGRAAIAADREGAAFGFWEGPAPVWSDGPRAPARVDLQSRHAFEAAIFYAEVFDWTRPHSRCSVDYAQDRVLVRAGGHTVVTVRGGGVENDPDPRLRARWVIDFLVADSRRTAAEAVAAGGEATPVEGLPETAYVICDPEGALFTVSDR